jgi:hypothetical protein
LAVSGNAPKGANMSSRKYYKSWNIKGIAESVIEEIKEDGEDLDNVLDYYLQSTYWSIYSKEPKDAVIVVELVKQYIGEMESLS